jgi:hypothetical protein
MAGAADKSLRNITSRGLSPKYQVIIKSRPGQAEIERERQQRQQGQAGKK